MKQMFVFKSVTVHYHYNKRSAENSGGNVCLNTLGHTNHSVQKFTDTFNENISPKRILSFRTQPCSSKQVRVALGLFTPVL